MYRIASVLTPVAMQEITRLMEKPDRRTAWQAEV